jgi:hypothetical protein
MADRWRDLKGLTRESRVWWLDQMLKPDLRNALEAALIDNDRVTKQLKLKEKEIDKLTKKVEMQAERSDGVLELVNEGRSSRQPKVKEEDDVQPSMLKGTMLRLIDQSWNPANTVQDKSKMMATPLRNFQP